MSSNLITRLIFVIPSKNAISLAFLGEFPLWVLNNGIPQNTLLLEVRPLTAQANTSQNTGENTPFSNNNVSVELTRKPGCEVHMDVMVQALPTTAARKKAVKKINKEVSVPGFRKGKAPSALLEKQYGKYIKEEWHDLLLNTAFEEATKLADTFPLSRSSVKVAKIDNCSVEEGAKVHFEFESYPCIPQVDEKTIQLKKVEKKQISEDDVAKSIERVRDMCASIEVITDRPAQEGDLVDIDLDILSDPASNVFTNKRYILNEEEMEPWLYRLVVGLSTDESAEGDSESPEGAEAKDFEAKKHRVSLKAISAKILPELNDELAEKVGAKNVEDMTDNLRKRLEKDAEDEVNLSLREQIDSSLLDSYPFEVPASLVEAERRSSLKEKIASLKKEGLDDEAISSKQTELEEEVEKEVDKKLRLLFLIQNIAEQKNISVTHDDLNKKMSLHAMELAMGGWADKTEEEKQRIYAYFSSLALEEKVKDYLISQAELV